MKITMRKHMVRIMIIALAIVFVVGFAPQMGVPVFADDSDPDISLSTDQLAKNAAEDGAQIVNYGGREWYVIAYDSKDGNGDTITYENAGGETVALHPEGAVALYQKGSTESSWFNETIDPIYHYAYGYVDQEGNTASSLRQSIESIYVSGDNPCLSASEQEAIIPRTLAGGNVPLDNRYWPTGHDKNTIANKALENAVVWPLSIAEAEHVAGSILGDQSGQTWLRTPGCPEIPRIDIICATSVHDAFADYNGIDVRQYGGVRPGFYLDMNQVMFTSSAYGGKTCGKIGPRALKKVGENDDGEWKVTLLKSEPEKFYITMEDPVDCMTPKFQYEGASTGENEYISAIIVDKDVNIKYYGRIKKCADDTDASGELTIDLKGKINDGDELLVFSEQCNGDGKTDYSSVPRSVYIPDFDAPHNLSKTDQAAATMTEPGNKEYWTCSKCGRYFGDEGGTQLIDKDSWVIACPSNFDFSAVTYNGEEKKPDITVTDTNAQVISPDNYDVAYGNNVNAGTNATAKITFKGDLYSGEENRTFTIKKADNTLKVNGKTAKVKVSTVKKKSQALDVTKVITFTNIGQGKMSYDKLSGNKKITIAKTTGKVTVKKGLKKGTYKVKVKVKAKGNNNYRASAWQTVRFNVIVK